MVKLVCCDVDNTLLFDKRGSVSSEIFDIIGKLSDSLGVIFAAVSGRPLVDMVRLFAPVVDKIIIAAYDGAVVLYKGKLLFDRPIDKNIYMAFARGFKGESFYGAPLEYILYTAGCACVPSSSGVAAKGLIESVTMGGFVREISSPEEICEPVYKISVRAGDKGADFDYTVKDWSLYLNNIYSGSEWCEFVSEGTDKGFAVNMIMEKFGIASAEAMAFGDGANDVAMLSSCDFSYAMLNGSVEAKAVSAYVTDDVARSLKEFFRL